MDTQVDALIVTALKLEYDEVLHVDEGAEPGGRWEVDRGPYGLDVAQRTFLTPDGAPLRVAVTRATGMGTTPTLTAAMPLVERFAPKCVAMCGVCAGRPNKGVALGDVIIASRLWTYDTGKVLRERDEATGREETRILGDMMTYLLPSEWVHRADSLTVPANAPWLATRPIAYESQRRWALERAFEGALSPDLPMRLSACPDWGYVIEGLWNDGMLERDTLDLTVEGRASVARARKLQPDGPPTPPPFRVHVAPIATGSRVVEDRTIFDQLSVLMRTVLGLEMEASAIGAIAYAQAQHIRGIVMKGVMDLANVGRDDRYKIFAARASAECLLQFLRENLEPGGERLAASGSIATSGERNVTVVVSGTGHHVFVGEGTPSKGR